MQRRQATGSVSASAWSALRIGVGTVTLVAAAAFVPLGLVLDAGAWVTATAAAWIFAGLAIHGLVRRRRLALLAPLVLVALWLAVQ
jgi:hypothetical protein